MRPYTLGKKQLSLISACAFAFALIFLLMYVSSTDNVLTRLGSVLFVEPFCAEMPIVPKAVAFATWLAVAAAIAKARKPSRRFRPALLVLLPVLSIYAFNALFKARGAAPAVAPAAVVAVIGVLLYEISVACGLTRLTMAAFGFAVGASYGAATALGLWGGVVAAGAMAVVQLVWSGMEMNVFRLTSARWDRESGYR